MQIEKNFEIIFNILKKKIKIYLRLISKWLRLTKALKQLKTLTLTILL